MAHDVDTTAGSAAYRFIVGQMLASGRILASHASLSGARIEIEISAGA